MRTYLASQGVHGKAHISVDVSKYFCKAATSRMLGSRPTLQWNFFPFVGQRRSDAEIHPPAVELVATGRHPLPLLERKDGQSAGTVCGVVSCP